MLANRSKQCYSEGMNIKEFLLKADMTQVAFAEKVGADQAFVNQWIGGHRPVPVKFARRIEQVTGGDVTRQELCPDWMDIWPELATTQERLAA